MHKKKRNFPGAKQKSGVCATQRFPGARQGGLTQPGSAAGAGAVLAADVPRRTGQTPDGESGSSTQGQ